MSVALTALLILSGGVSQPQAATELVWKQPPPSELRSVYGVRWKAELGSFELLATNHEEWTQPLISPDGARAYIGTRVGVLEARAVEDGRRLWKREDMGALGASMFEFRGAVFVGSDADLVALGRVRGKERWKLELGGRIGGRVTVTGTVAILPVRPNAFYAVDLVDQRILWSVKRSTPEGLTVRGQAGPAVDPVRGAAYLGFSDGSLVAVNVRDGSRRWVASLGSSTDFFADVDTKPVLLDGGGALLVAAYNTGLFRLDADTGGIQWSKKEHRRLVALEKTEGDFVIASHGEGQVIGFDPAEGKVRWRYRMKSGAPSAPMLLPGGLVAVSSSEGPLSILEAKSGRPIQVLATGSGASVPPAVTERDMLLLSNRGLALALKFGGGQNVVFR